MAWLNGWSKRIELDIDYTNKISGSVTWFPATVFLTATQAEEVFAELTTDEEYELMQFTEADGTSLLYGHMKVFDVSETKGIFAVSADGWTIDGNTSIFLYYDAGHVVNDTYIGATNTSACENVYNPQYKAVYGMANGADNAHIYDATSNNKDGTKEGANQPTETTGKVGQAQLFDVHYIETSLTGMDSYSYITMEFLIKPLGGSGVIFDWYEDDDNKGYLYYNAAIDRIQVSLKLGASWADNQIIDSEVLEDTYYLVTIVWNGSNTLAYIDGVSKTISFDTENNTPIALSTITHTPFGTQRQTGAYLPNVDIAINAIIDESHISNSVRSPAWIKGTYNSLWDDLFTYGSEETEPEEAVDNAIFFGTNF